MLYSQSLEEIYRLGNLISVKRIQVVDKKCREVFRQIIGLLKARAETVS